MGSQPQAAVAPPGSSPRRVVLGIVGSFIIAAMVGGWAYFRFSGHDLTGLEGTWRDLNNPKHLYEFRPNGAVDTWSGGFKSWWNRVGWSATWRRDGQQITVRADRNWDFKGRLDGGTIRGKVLIRNESGEVETEADAVWRRESGRAR